MGGQQRAAEDADAGGAVMRVMKGSWSKNGHHGTAPDALLNLYLQCSDGATAPAVMECTGEVVLAFAKKHGVEADVDPNGWYRLYADGTSERIG